MKKQKEIKNWRERLWHIFGWEENNQKTILSGVSISMMEGFIQGVLIDEKKKWKEEVMEMCFEEDENIYNGEVQKDGSRLYTVDPQRVRDRNKLRHELYQQLRVKLEGV